MGFIDVDKIIHVIPNEITDDEKETLYKDICTLEITPEIDGENALKLFEVAQEILKFKGEQVESLITELDGLAAKLGEEEAKRSHSYVEVEEYEASIRKINENNHDKLSGTDDYQRKLMKMEIQRDRLITELQEREQELIAEKKELEKLTTKVTSLSDENKALRNELQTLQHELASSSTAKLATEDEEYMSVEKYHELSELLRQKNKHITQLLNDIEEIERENIVLKDKLSIVRDELAEGATQMSKISMERITLNTRVDELNGKVLKLEQENIGLRNQIAELVVEREKRDKQLERMNANFEEKLQQWKDILEKKELELTNAKYRKNSTTTSRQIDETDHLMHLSNLHMTLTERDEKILELQQQLEQATKDLNDTTRLLEEQKKIYTTRFDKNAESTAIKHLKKKLEQTESRIAVLEARTKFAEEESLRKAEEVSELIIQLREYESGTFGLDDAMLRIKDLKKQKQVRDTQIEQLVQNSNELQDEVNFLEQENLILRQKVGIPPGEEILGEEFSRKNHNRHNKLTELTNELEKSRDEFLSIKLENRKLNKQISSLITELNFYRIKESTSVDSEENRELSDHEMIDTYYKNTLSVAVQSNYDEGFTNEIQESDDRFRDIIEENESLRKGMHEILDSIRNRDSTSLVQIESETLERLLEALDSRHINGWYQPAMRLQAHIHHLYGVNKTLREELHGYRFREAELLYDLHEASQKIGFQQKSVEINKPVSAPPQLLDRKMPSTRLVKSASCSDETLRLLELEKELNNEKEKCSKLQLEIETFREKFAQLQEEMNEIHEKYEEDKESWNVVKMSMQNDVDTLRNNEAALQLKVNEYEKSLQTLKESPEDIERKFAEMSLSTASLKVEQQQLTRRCESLLDMEARVRQEKNKLFNDMYNLKFTKDLEIAELRKINDHLAQDLKTELSQSGEYVSRRDYERVTNDFNGLVVKHRETQQKQILLQSEKEKLMCKLQNEITSLRSQKLELEVILKQTIEEMQNLKSSKSNEQITDELAALSKQVASLELDGINKKQYSDHVTRMYDLTKEQLTETENRCKQLEEQLLLAVQNNSELQKSEAMLKEKVMTLPNLSEFDELQTKLRETENNIISLRLEKNELEEIANIAQDQVKTLEQYHRYQDFEYDSLQRRILELQLLSDEKLVIDRLTKELLLMQQNGNNANDEIDRLKEKLTKTETEMLQLKMKLNETEGNYNKLKRDSNMKIKSSYMVIFELQKRYLGSFPLVKEELCFDNLMQRKLECYELTSLILDMKLPSILNINENENVEGEKPVNKHKSKYRMQDFSLRLINEGLQNKIQIYAERLERQDKLISRLEQEIVHAEEQCQEFLLYWSSQDNGKFSAENGMNSNSKSTQTIDLEEKYEKMTNSDAIDSEPNMEINQLSDCVQELRRKLQLAEEELRGTRDRLNELTTELEEKQLLISNKENEILNLRKIGFKMAAYSTDNENDDEDSIRKLALKETVDNLQNIVNQKEEIVTRLHNKLKMREDEHRETTFQLEKEIKTLQNTIELKDHDYDRIKSKLDMYEKTPNEKRAIIDSHLTKIHELEDEINQLNEKVEQLSNQLTTSNQQAELWSHTAEERLKSLQTMKHELDIKYTAGLASAATEGKLSPSSLLQTIKEKSDEIEKQNQTIEELKKRLGSGEKLPGYRDRLKNELERNKRKVELLEQREKEDKAEIQRLKNQILTRPQSARKRETLVTPKEEQLMKKVKTLEEQLEEYVEKEKKWKENHRIKVDGEIEKWHSKKRYQQICEKLRQQLKDQLVHYESLKLSNARMKETVGRLEKERFALESKLKAAKSHAASMSLIEELQKTNQRQEEEIRILRLSSQLLPGGTSLANVIEAQDRKIKALEIAQKGDSALAEEVERLNERKSQLQKYNVQLEEENLRLKMKVEQLKSNSRNLDELSDFTTRNTNSDRKFNDEDIENQLKGNKRRNSDLERAVLVLRRVVEKLQAENKRLYNNKVSQVQDKGHVEKLHSELQNLQENYLDAIERVSVLDKQLQNANEKIESLQKLIDRLQNGEETNFLRSQLTQKNHLLSKVKVLLEKALLREKELTAKIQDLQKTNPSIIIN